MFQIRGSKIISAARGMRIIVALSSIYFNEGTSPKTVRGARSSEITNGVPIQK